MSKLDWTTLTALTENLIAAVVSALEASIRYNAIVSAHVMTVSNLTEWCANIGSDSVSGVRRH